MRFATLALRSRDAMSEDNWLAVCAIWTYLYYSSTSLHINTDIDMWRAIDEGIILG